MGNWWSNRLEVLPSCTRNRRQEKEILQAIMQFDFNDGDTNGITFEETLMRQMTNDLGEFIMPHVAHILFIEFKKFMFLVYMNVSELKDQGIK